MTLAKAGGSIAIIPYIAIIVITIVFPVHSLGEVGDEATYYVYGTVTIYLEDSGPTIYYLYELLVRAGFPPNRSSGRAC